MGESASLRWYIGAGSAGAFVVLLVALSVWLFSQGASPKEERATPIESVEQVDKKETPLESVAERVGASVENRPIELYRFGTGSTTLLFVGGIHGGYEWNSTALAYEVIEYFMVCNDCVPEGLSVLVIPTLNPDGLAAVFGTSERSALFTVPKGHVQELLFTKAKNRDATVHGRFNANTVDLNRNFACKWQDTAVWKGQEVSAGSEAFSEPEARALRDLVLREKPSAVVFWHSKAGAVYASECEEGVLPETVDIMNAYATATGYTAIAEFDAYPVTGDAEGWLASIGIPAITVELETHNATEWEKNKAGIEAVLEYYGK